MSQLDQLIVFSHVVEMGSFIAVGDYLGISANAVSKQVTQLEKQLGLTLLERSTRQLFVTEIGKIIYEKGKNVQKNMDEINAFAQSAKTEPSGGLSIVSAIGIGQYLLVPHLENFLEQYPKLTLKLHLADKFSKFRADREIIDIAYAFPQTLIPDTLTDTNLVRRRLGELGRSIYASPTYLKMHGQPKNYEDLSKHLLVFHSSNYKSNLLKECDKRKITLNKIFYLNNTAAILNCVVSGLGIALIPDFVAQTCLADGKLKKILCSHHEPSITTYFFYKKTPYLPVKISCFVDFFNDRLREPYQTL